MKILIGFSRDLGFLLSSKSTFLDVKFTKNLITMQYVGFISAGNFSVSILNPPVVEIWYQYFDTANI